MPNTVTPPARTIEANHRIANELAQLAALLKRQIDAAARGPESLSRESVVNTLRLHHGRLLGISRLHHAISREPDADDVDLTEVLASLLREFEASGVFERRLSLNSTLAPQCRVDAAQASAVTLAFSEIVTNAMKYAHPTGLPVEMTVIATAAADGTVALIIADDGVGFPENFVEARDAGVGLKLVRALMENVGGRLAMSSSELGLRFDIELRRSRDRRRNDDARPVGFQVSHAQSPGSAA
ncbi:Two-component sensor histidine kinase, contains HisKA and HATPase domains [Rhodospirillales bacterium URHD0017]|nr:Two-component sensor histidine kinase, contains HisKA and HATPase domains [Rhodospirillales bacterium URHD0017]